MAKTVKDKIQINVSSGDKRNEKLKQDKEERQADAVPFYLQLPVVVSFFKKHTNLIFEQKAEEVRNSWGKSISNRGKSECKGPEAGSIWDWRGTCWGRGAVETRAESPSSPWTAFRAMAVARFYSERKCFLQLSYMI